MTCREFVQECQAQNQLLLDRADAAVAQLNGEAWNQAPKGGWSPAQVFEHMCLGNAPYLDAIPSALSDAKPGDDAPSRHTWLGRTIRRMAGPGGNAPAPRAMIPGPGPYAKESYDKWQKQQTQIIKLHERAAGLNIAAVKVRNPFLRFARMTLCDCYGILTAHTERHVSQVEARVLPRD
jgi:hypothetical protein